MQDITSNDALVKWRVAASNVERLEKDESALKEQIATLEHSLENWAGAKRLLEILKNHKLEKRKDFILTIINSALRDIFESDYRLDIIPKEMKGKSVSSTQKYDIVFYQNGIEIARNNELLSSNGGGVLSVASLFFKILIGYLYSKNKFYIFDEALSQVSPQYRERLSLFLREFCEKYGFTLVIVSQTEELETHAHLVYEVNSDIDKNNIPILNIVNIIGEQPQTDYFFSIIENFQSIKSASFFYKGFTIIRGPNNSGKSATLRAIESLIFNNFNTNLYPRKNPNGKKLTTKIVFGHVDDQGNIKEIELRYKSNKIMFVIEGEEYFGKNLAADKLREAVEEIGFRYIDMKNMYKNFKGDLKEQTERIAYTNQYDGLFLVGAKTSDSEKIFSFLFNTENIALAIAQAKEAMQEQNKEHKELQVRLLEIQDDLNKKKKLIDYYLKIYYFKIIEEYLTAGEQKDYLRKIEYNYIQLSTRIEAFINMVEGTNWLVKNKELIDIYRNKIEHNNMLTIHYNNIIEKINSLEEIQKFINIVSELDTIKFKDRIVAKIIPLMQNIISIDYFVNLNSQQNILEDSFRTIAQKEHDLGLEYNLKTCECCLGEGVVPTSKE